MTERTQTQVKAFFITIVENNIPKFKTTHSTVTVTHLEANSVHEN